MRHTYRRPFDYAQRAAQIEWQPQPSWDIDCSSASLSYATYPVAIGLEPTIVCSAATMTYTAYRAAVSGDIAVTATLATMGYTTYRATADLYRIIYCTSAIETMSGQPATLTATRRHIPVRSMRVRSTGNILSVRGSRNTMSARGAHNRIKVA